MRIAIAAGNGRQIGGTETYLMRTLPALRASGHDVAFLHEIDLPLDREPVGMIPGVPRWCAEAMGGTTVLEALRAWRPDVVYAHGMFDPKLETSLLDAAPVIFRAHNYYGTCVSGAKTFKSPQIQHCTRRFGAACLLQYYPRRCGGWNPLTMWAQYRHETQRLAFLQSSRVILANSRHIALEYLRQGVSADRVQVLASPTEPPIAPESRGAGARDEWRLLFMGRMDALKGGEALLAALPGVCTRVQHPVRVTYAGDGPQRRRWEACARAVQARTPRLAIDFVGWLDEPKRENLWAECDLFVLPSLWPEPYGLVGLEAGRHGLPVAAFAAGGIPEWLIDGVNGHLAPGDPPTVAGLADAIVRCLASEASYERLRAGARQTVARVAAAPHLSRLVEIFERAAAEGIAR